MAITTLDDLMSEYSAGCGDQGPVATRDQLHEDYQAWAEVHGVSARYEETAQAYLDDDDGPYDESTMRDWLDESARAIAEHLRQVVPEATLHAYLADTSGNDSLDQYRALVATRLAGSYCALAWNDAMDVLAAKEG